LAMTKEVLNRRGGGDKGGKGGTSWQNYMETSEDPTNCAADA